MIASQVAPSTPLRKQKRTNDTAFFKRTIATYAEIAGRAGLSAEINLVIEGTKPESFH